MHRGFDILERWLTYLESHDGRLLRRKKGGLENDQDVVCTIPNPPGAAIFTVGDLREVVEGGRKLREAEAQMLQETT